VEQKQECWNDGMKARMLERWKNVRMMEWCNNHWNYAITVSINARTKAGKMQWWLIPP
jgi:hypothetical protein